MKNNHETVQQLLAMAPEHHARMKAKGFWDEPINEEQKLMLIVSEIGELVEAHRMDKRAKLEPNFIGWFEDFQNKSNKLALEVMAGYFKAEYESQVKGSIEEELADIALRVMDWIGYRGANLLDIGQEELDTVMLAASDMDLFTILKKYNKVIFWEDEWTDSKVKWLIGLANKLDVDLLLHVRLKMAYNETRVHRHGKAY